MYYKTLDSESCRRAERGINLFLLFVGGFSILFTLAFVVAMVVATWIGLAWMWRNLL